MTYRFRYESDGCLVLPALVIARVGDDMEWGVGIGWLFWTFTVWRRTA